jgi:hypothetical protein
MLATSEQSATSSRPRPPVTEPYFGRVLGLPSHGIERIPGQDTALARGRQRTASKRMVGLCLRSERTPY